MSSPIVAVGWALSGVRVRGAYPVIRLSLRSNASLNRSGGASGRPPSLRANTRQASAKGLAAQGQSRVLNNGVPKIEERRIPAVSGF